MKTPSQTLRISEGREQSTSFSVHVNDKLGSGTITFIATAGGQGNTAAFDHQRAPATDIHDQVRSSSFTKTSVDVPTTRNMYPEFRQLDCVRFRPRRSASPRGSMLI